MHHVHTPIHLTLTSLMYITSPSFQFRRVQLSSISSPTTPTRSHLHVMYIYLPSNLTIVSCLAGVGSFASDTSNTQCNHHLHFFALFVIARPNTMCCVGASIPRPACVVFQLSDLSAVESARCTIPSHSRSSYVKGRRGMMADSSQYSWNLG